MDLINVDHVRLQTAQRILDLLNDPGLACVAVGIAVLPGQSDFGRDHSLFAAAVLGQRLADDLLGATKAVNRRGIDEIYPAVERRMDRLNRFMLVRPAPHPTADRPGSKRNARNFERSGKIFHLSVTGVALQSHGLNPSSGGWVLLLTSVDAARKTGLQSGFLGRNQPERSPVEIGVPPGNPGN